MEDRTLRRERLINSTLKFKKRRDRTIRNNLNLIRSMGERASAEELEELMEILLSEAHNKLSQSFDSNFAVTTTIKLRQITIDRIALSLAARMMKLKVKHCK